MAAQIALWHTRRESYWRILSYLMVPQSHHQHMRPPSHMQSIIDLNVINQCLAAVLYKLFSLGITSSFSTTAQRWVAEFDVLKCIKLLFSVSSPAFHIHLVIAQPTVCQGCRSRCSAQLRTRRQALGRGTLQRRHTLHGEGCFRRFWWKTASWCMGSARVFAFIHLQAFFTLGPCFKFTFSEAHFGHPSLFPNAFSLEPRNSHLHFISPWFLFVYLFILPSAPKRKLREVRASEPVWFNVVSPTENEGRVCASHRSWWTL